MFVLQKFIPQAQQTGRRLNGGRGQSVRNRKLPRRTLSPLCSQEHAGFQIWQIYLSRPCHPTGETKHTIVVSREFIRDNEVEDMVICLKLYNLKGYLEMFGNKEILVTNDGINPEGIRPSLIE